MLKPVISVAGDVVEIGPDAVTVNGQRLAGTSSSSVDSLGRALPHAVQGRYIVGADELWLVSRAGAEQLGQPIPRADLDVAGVVGRAPGMDDRLMLPSSGAGDAEARE